MEKHVRNHILKDLARKQIKDSFISEYQDKASIPEGLGLVLSRFFQYSGYDILKTCYYALEDSNFHGQAEKIESILEEF
jgi:hypothetical protein